MSDDSDRVEHPVLAGLGALVIVGLVIGLLAGAAAWAGAETMHLNNVQAQDAAGNAGATLYLPTPSVTDSQQPNGLISQSVGNYPSASAGSSDAGVSSIQLTSVENSVASMGRIDLTGSYPSGDGAILQVQRLENGTWADFNVTCGVTNGNFSTWIQTGRSGANKFRVIDTQTQAVSNAVQVNVS